MIKIIKYSNGQSYRPNRKDPVRLTALIYLKEALLKEQYEACGDIITIAREFGARDREIKDLLEDPRRSPT